MEAPVFDENLIVAAKRGSLKAFDAMVSFYQAAIYNHLYRLLGNSDDALDLTQDTFIKVYKNRSKIDTDKNFRAWLYKIATNTAYDWLKKQKRLPKTQEIDEAAEFETNELSLSYYSIEQINNLDLENALKSLKSGHESVIRLYYQQGFSYVEISEILQIPLNTVKTNISRAKAELLKKIN